MKLYCDKQELKKKSKDELVDNLYDSLVEIDKLKRELRKYKNPNTPPSAHPFLKPAVRPVRRHRRGAPKGHPGTTRPWLVPHEVRHILGKECPNCHSKYVGVIGQKHQQQEEMPPEIRPQTVDVVRDVCKCNKCGLKFLARDGMTPLQGRFGINLIVLVIFLKFIVRGVLRKTSSFLDASFDLKLAPASVQAIIERAAKAGEAEYSALKSKIKTAKLLYIDETSFRVLGLNWWVWAFRSDTDLLLVIRNSRSSKVLEEILGKDYTGTIVCDCWRAYDFLSNATLQRCWAHLLRKSAELESVAGRHFHKKLSKLFDRILNFNSKERTEQQRGHKYLQMTAELQKVISYYSRYEECQAVVKYIDFHIESWFTCIKILGVQPTNNYAEQAIRETVLVRKIIGAFRSEKGTKTYETLASLIATWQIQKKEIKTEFNRMLSTNLC
ncbi:MAG TPA: IS66 family transposase [Candidatus Nanoarchaeia archaeon]|nr:IS66 family transposase [Candidatus Nanoarchaeia archaeon]